jgi:predicted lysophospholipase L1 biosynthesis ABC-type transport system permease subunit
MGVHYDTADLFGGFWTTDGVEIPKGPGTSEAYVNRAFIQNIGVGDGGNIFLIKGNTTYSLQVTEVISASGLGGYGGDRPFIFINQNLASLMEGRYGLVSSILLSFSSADDNVSAATARVSHVLSAHSELPMRIAEDKSEEEARSGEVLSIPVAMLTIFGLLTILMGAAILLNLHKLMMEGRRDDLGILRALGMPRRDMLLVMVDEGLILAIIGSGLGTLLGVVMAWLCLGLLQNITAMGWQVPLVLHIDPGTLLLSFSSGVAVVILVFGAYFARFVYTALVAYLRNVGVREAGLVARLAFYAIMVFVILIAVDQIGLGDVIRQTFLIIVAAIALALALAFGLGGQRRAAELLERWSRQDADETEAPPSRRRSVL